jgi:hypothetical protein
MSRLRHFSIFAVLLTASLGRMPGATPPGACHIATLRNGFTIQFSRLDVEGKSTRLWLCAEAGTGYVEFPSEQIGSTEQGQSVIPPAPATARGTAPTATGALPAASPIKDLITSTASRHQVDPDFVASVVKAESGFNPTAISPKGAQGLMQLMPQTAARLGVGDAFDAAANLEGGTKYLRRLLDQYGGDAAKALAAYNAGPGRVEQYGGVPPYRETRAYVARIIEDYSRRKLQQQAPAAGPNAAPPADK